MSIHKSLAIKAALVRSRNVLTRYERILQLRKSGKWKEDESSAYGLAKVRVLKVKKRGKEKKKKDETAVAAPGAAPAAALPAAAAPGGKAAGGKAASGKAAPAAKK